jgi:hypothetical protein
MKRKSVEYRLLFALKVIQLDPNARVLYATGTRYSATAVWTMLMNLPGKPAGMTYKLHSREVCHENGGMLLVRDVENPSQVSGMQMSHVWIDGEIETFKSDYIASRMRSNHKHSPEPMGMYDEWKVVRIQDY